jgi:type IV pilus assembly protein PilX
MKNMQIAIIPARQRGAALLIGLIFLVVTTVIAVVAIGSTVLQERMTSGQRNDSLAQQGAESALRGAELALWNAYINSDGRDAPSGTFAAEPLSSDAHAFREATSWTAGGAAYATIDYDAIARTAGSGRLDRDPRFIIERLPGTGCLEAHCGGTGTGSGAVGMTDYFRVTARSTGGDAKVIRSNESVYAMGH